MLGPYLPYPFVTLSNMPCPCHQVLVCEVFLHLRVLLPGSDDFFSQMGVVAHQGQIPQGHNCTQQCPNWSGQQKSFCYLFPLLSSIWDSQSVGPWGNAEDQKNSRPRQVWPSNMVAAKKWHCPTEGRDSLSPAPADSCPQTNPVMGKTLCPNAIPRPSGTVLVIAAIHLNNLESTIQTIDPTTPSHIKRNTQKQTKTALLRWSASSQRTNTHTTGWNTKKHNMGWLPQSNSHDSSHMWQCCYSLSRSIWWCHLQEIMSIIFPFDPHH